MLFIIGIGLGDEKDISVRGLEAVKSCVAVFLEGYTSLLVNAEHLEEFYGKKVTIADRDCVEGDSIYTEVIERARTENVAFLVVGDAFGATTHCDLVLRAHKEGIAVQVINNAGIMNAVGCAGLALYNYGIAVSLCFWTDSWQPDSGYEKIRTNREHGMHTLVLLDIKVKEQSIENLCRGRKIYEPPRFMTTQQAAEQLIAVEERRKLGAYAPDTWAVALARVGGPTQKIVYAPLKDLVDIDMGAPLHCMIIPGQISPIEEEFLSMFKLPATAASEH